MNENKAKQIAKLLFKSARKRGIIKTKDMYPSRYKLEFFMLSRKQADWILSYIEPSMQFGGFSVTETKTYKSGGSYGARCGTGRYKLERMKKSITRD